MTQTCKLIIFDYGRTLYDRDFNQLFDDAAMMVQTLSTHYQLAIVSISTKADEAQRIQTLTDAKILSCFEAVAFTDRPADKVNLYDSMLKQLNIKPQQTAVVDDYVLRGVAWGNQVGATTVWYRNGKFSETLPDSTTGMPTHTIDCLSELLEIFMM